MGPVSGELVALLPPQPSSVARARQLVVDALDTTGDHDLGETAALVVSEVVTNSILHAGTEIRLRCRPLLAGVRVDVSDGSPLVPTVRHYDTDSTTGRGLALVSALTTSWGVDEEPGGKTVWFEITRGRRRNDRIPESEVDLQPAPGPGTGTIVRLCGASPALIRATIEHGDALLRELALVALGGELADAPVDNWHRPQFDVSPVLAAAEAVTSGERLAADLELHLASDVGAAADDRRRLVDRADALAREGRLLCAPALPEIAVCRHWLYRQIVEQAAGFPPQEWELPDRLEPARAAARLPTDEVSRLTRTASPTVVADDANRIIFVNDAAGELLGWAPEMLAGQRLIVLIPPEFREAHLAGFSRLQVTGEAHILGKRVHVPALRRDGATVEVALLIEQLEGTGDRRVFRAALSPAAGRGPAQG